ncbi:AHH domain-containing protein [Erythrobacter crassostreae]|uniref:AHH domain-containing protein n=1 Tax=Erythrobacter crassostreae TaxID=2828328 RepID=A0A9X1F416_9SPHN|nr:AHH domain-containing protein [Erythrobacter crassostrea]MBV7259860.1 AHH domain-containing protein [Erythrobacter crassostrea]
MKAATGGLSSRFSSLRCGSNRRSVSFRSVNRSHSAGYDPELQRHHLLPLQLLSKPCFGSMFAVIGRSSVGFDDFRFNGLLLPASEAATLRTGMPLHRGPHRSYNELVCERVGSIEAHWKSAIAANAEDAIDDVLMRLRLLQTALRRRLLQERRRFILNRKDPLGTGFDFAELDAMAESLWEAT